MSIDFSDVPMKETMFMRFSPAKREEELIRIFRTLEEDDKQLLYGNACVLAHRIESRSKGKIINIESKRSII